MDVIESDIKRALEEIPAQATVYNWGTRAWTSGVKQALVDVGRRSGFLVGARDCNADHPEWLYDVFWYQLDQANHLTDIPFVAECEWDSNAVKYDFEKLLVARAKYRVMVFQTDTHANVLQLIQTMKLWLYKYFRTQSGDRYFFAGWAKTHWVFEHYVV